MIWQFAMFSYYKQNFPSFTRKLKSDHKFAGRKIEDRISRQKYMQNFSSPKKIITFLKPIFLQPLFYTGKELVGRFQKWRTYYCRTYVFVHFSKICH